MATMRNDPVDIEKLLRDLIQNIECEIQTRDSPDDHKPVSPDYHENILRWSDVVVNRPAIIALPDLTTEISYIILACVRYHVDFAVACGRHTTSSASSSNGGLIIDLQKIKYVVADEDSMTVRIGGGCRWKDVDDRLVGKGLALVAGIVNDTGIGGITLGGGYGWLAPKYGLIIDNLLQAKVVLADGSVAIASESQHPDLFWAIRGAGQCFGVVVEFIFKAHKHKDPVWGGTLMFSHGNIESIIEFGNNLIETTNGDSSMVVQLSRYPFAGTERSLGIMVSVFHYGKKETALPIFQPLLDLGPVVDTTMERTYASVNNMLTADARRGGRNVSKGAAFTTPLRPEFIREKIIPAFEAIHLNIAGGDRSLIEFEFYKPDKWCETPVVATAHGHRGPFQNAMVMLYWNDVMEDIRMEAWCRVVAQLVADERSNNGRPAVGPVTEYGNYDHLSADPRDVFGVNYQRLVDIKAQYDPSNVFNKWYQL
ncbi:FAD-binding oxidoreductase [Aspergillus stella-maris]|uniref:FAD-binding oxidoreductase n=1 Tax=Aspergillus stella-maris TaxID=1810926 RepID=UPI003CCC9A7A